MAHRLVLETFTGPCPSGMEGCHNDGNPKNLFRENLRWDTHKNNSKDMSKHGTQFYAIGSKSGRSKLNNWKVRIIKRLLEDKFLTPKEIAAIFNISLPTISNIKCKKRWCHI